MRKGFTLIELIIVIIIVGILAALGITQYTKVIEKGRAAEARTILGSLRSAEVAEMNENGAYVVLSAASPDSLAVGAPAVCAGTHYFSYACAADATGCIATRCTAGGKGPQGASAYTKSLAIDGTWGGSTGY